MNMWKTAIIIAMGLILHGCAKPIEPTVALDITTDDNHKTAYEKTIGFGGEDWSDACSDIDIIYSWERDKPIYKEGTTYFAMPNGTLLYLNYKSKKRMIIDSEEWKSSTGDDDTVSRIGVGNSRMLARKKQDRAYGARRFYQEANGKTVIEGFLDHPDSHFIYKGMPLQALANIMETNKISLTTINDKDLALALFTVNQKRKLPGFPTPGDLSKSGDWKSAQLANGITIYIQSKQAHADHLVSSLIYLDKDSGEHWEMELVNVSPPNPTPVGNQISEQQ
jgi:hypothetical protein